MQSNLQSSFFPFGFLLLAQVPFNFVKNFIIEDYDFTTSVRLSNLLNDFIWKDLFQSITNI